MTLIHADGLDHRALNEQIRQSAGPCIIDGCCGQRFIAAGMTGREIEIRMIMVPEHNMAEEALRAAGEFLAPLKHISAVRLLAYHTLARSKFKAVGHPDTMPESESTPLVYEIECNWTPCRLKSEGDPVPADIERCQ